VKAVRGLGHVAKLWACVLVALLAAAGLVVAAVPQAARADTAITGVDLSRYALTGRYDLPEPTRTQAPPNSLLAQEASSVTYDWDTGTLFVVGDGGTSVVQVSKTGQLIDSMTLAPGDSPQGTTFYDTEAITYVGSGQFVLGEERYRQLDLFTYVPGGVLTAADVQTVKLGTTIGNIGIEGVSSDPQTSTPGSPGFIAVKEKQPESIFQTNIDWAAGTATNGSATTDESTNLFDPALAGLNDFSDVFALSNLPNLTGPDTSHLLIISQESGKIENVDRSGNVESSLTIEDPNSPISVADETHEGVTMDRDGNLYTVSEDGGGDENHPQLWVYSPTNAPDQPPTAVELQHQVTSVPADIDTTSPVRVADVAVVDDGTGTNDLSVSGPDAADFQVDSSGLYIKAGTAFNAAVQSTYNVTVNVDDPAVGASPDASASFTLTVTPASGTPAGVTISEVAPWGSGDTPYAADWFEVTNNGPSAVDLTGWSMDDNSDDIADAVPLSGVPSIPAGKSAVFFEDTSGSDATIESAFAQAWFGTSALPSGFLIGHYGGSGVGLSTGGDAVNLFDAAGDPVTGIAFGTSSSSAPFATFDNTAGAGSTTLPLPVISALSAVGVNGAFRSVDGQEIGSPGGPTTDHTPPGVTATATPPANANGWNNGPVTVSFPCTDAGTGVDQAASSLADVVLTASGTATGTCVDRAGNSATRTYTAQIDTAAPTVTYAGDAGTYPLLATVAITCGPADALSGIATSTCQNENGPAWSFGAGEHTLSAQATDEAGNSASASATFNVTVKPADLCTLTTQFVHESVIYQTADLIKRIVVSALVTVACNAVLGFTPSANPAAKAKLIQAYGQAVQALAFGSWLTTSQATTLASLAAGI
jgi:uncharacterized protein YjiK